MENIERKSMQTKGYWKRFVMWTQLDADFLHRDDGFLPDPGGQRENPFARRHFYFMPRF